MTDLYIIYGTDTTNILSRTFFQLIANTQSVYITVERLTILGFISSASLIKHHSSRQ